MGILAQSTPGQARYSGELHNLQITQSVFGTTAPIIIGTRRVAAKLLFYGGFYATPAPSGGGKGIGAGKGAQQFDYFADMQMALASGSASQGCVGLLNVWDQDGKLENETTTTNFTIPFIGSTSITVVSPQAQYNLGVVASLAYSVMTSDYGSGGTVTLTGTQQVPMQLVTGTPGAGQYNFNSSTSTYTFSNADRGKTVTITSSGVFSLYYIESVQPAQVPLSGPYQISTTNQAYFWQDQGVINGNTGFALTYGSGTQGYTESGGVYTFTSDLAGVSVYIRYSYTSNDANLTNTSSLGLSFYDGALGQAPNPYWQSKYPGAAFGYTGICRVDANPLPLGESAVMPQYNYEVMGLNIFAGGTLDAHPCDAFRTLLYDAFLGVGFPQANVDAWTSCYAYWAANGYLISKAIDTQTSITSAMQEVIETGNVGAVMSGGLLKLIPYGDATCVGNGYTYTPPSPVVTLGWNDLLPSAERKAGETGSDDPLQVTRRAAQDCWNYVQAQYCNRLNDYNNELINEQNDAFIQTYGRRIEAPQTWDWITSEAVAAWALKIRLNNQCYKRNGYKFWLPYWFSYIEPMDLVVLPTGETVRVTKVQDAPDGRLSIEAEQWSYGTANVTVYPKQASSSFQPTISQALPGDAVPIFIQQTLASSAGLEAQLQIAASGQSNNWGGCNVYVSTDGATYTPLGTVNAPAVIGQLTAALPSGADPDTADTLAVDIFLSSANPSAELVTVTQAQADSFTSLCAIVDQGGVTNEFISYETATLTASQRYNLTYLRRGVYGTTIAAHNAGAWFAFLGPNPTFLSFQAKPNFIGGNFYVKLQSFNLLGNQLQNLAQVAVWTIPILLTQGCGGQVTETFVPSSYSVTGSATVTNPTEAYDTNFETYANITVPGYSQSGNVIYAGFPNVTLDFPVLLCVSYNQVSRPAYVGAVIGYKIGSGAQNTFATVGQNAQGTASATIPAFTNLSTISVIVGVSSVSGPPIPAINVNEIWIQPPGGQTNATGSTPGFVQPDNTTTSVNAAGVLSANGALAVPPITLPAANGGTSYTLPVTPALPANSLYYVRGLKWKYGLDYSISGTRLTILNTAEAPQTGNKHELYSL